jgi:LysW-gamma-L-lysine carboxypeptidase
MAEHPTFHDRTHADTLLTGLVERYSPSGKESAAVTYLVDQMQRLGFRAYGDEAGNAVGELGSGERTLLLLGHIDTVPGYIDVRRESDLGGRSVRLYGRGTVDAKGPLATFVAAATQVGPRPGVRLMVVGAVEEEAATSKGARHLLGRLEPDAVIIGEPSGWDRITVGYKGRLLADYSLFRELGHTAGPERSVCEEAVAFWQQVSAYAAKWNDGRQGMYDPLMPSLRTMESSSDGFVETASMTLGFRLPLDLDIDGLEEALRAMGGDAELRFRGREIAFRASKNTPLIRAFLKAIRAQGGRPAFQVKSGTSDMNVVGPAWGCPILAYGPGDSTLDHTPHEHIDLNEYHRAIDVLALALADL